MALPEVDVVLIGVGWVGGIMAAELSRAGLNVVGLERGQPRDTIDFQEDHDEIDYAIRMRLMQDVSVETWTLRHSLQETALPLRYMGAFRPGNGVGGSGIHWGAQNWRFLPRDFTIRSHTIERYGASAIPSDVTIQDWGITYEEMEPYYDRFEKVSATGGKAGVLNGKKVPGGNPFEGSRSSEYPLPPALKPHTAALFEKAAAKLGYHPFPQPGAIATKPYTNPYGAALGPCTYCGFCTWYGCEAGAKADANLTVLPAAMKTGKFELRTSSYVYQIKHTANKAVSVLYYDGNGIQQEQPAGIVIVCAFPLNNVRLLMLSNMGTFYNPNTGQGLLGKNYAYQGSGGATGFFKGIKFKRYMGSATSSMCIDDFNGDNFDHSGLGFIGGGVVSCGSSGAAPIQSTAVPPNTPMWGSQWKSAIREWYDSVASVGMQGEIISYNWRMLDLDPTYKDAWGNPLLRITYDFADNERKMAAFIAPKCAEILKTMGADLVVPNMLAPHFDTVPYQSTHNTGGAIMGSDPSNSVVNNYLQMWDYDNVFVIGASAFPQNAGKNPTGTVGALAYRAADGIINKYLKSPGPLA